MKKPLVICICTAKGGVGKTTTTMALSENLASRGNSVLVIDADYQTSCTIALIGNENWEKLNKEKRTIVALVEDAINEGSNGYSRKFDTTTHILQRASNLAKHLDGQIDLLPSSPALAKAKKNIYKAGKDSEYASVNRLTFMEWGLRDILPEYDFVLIDTHPDIDDMLFASLFISDYYLMPVIPDAVSSYGIVQMQSVVKEFAGASRRNIRQLGVLISMFREINIHRTYRDLIQAMPNVRAFDAIIRQRAQVTESLDYWMTPRTLIQKYGSRPNGIAEDYVEFTDEVIRRCQEKRQ